MEHREKLVIYEDCQADVIACVEDKRPKSRYTFLSDGVTYYGFYVFNPSNIGFRLSELGNNYVTYDFNAYPVIAADDEHAILLDERHIDDLFCGIHDLHVEMSQSIYRVCDMSSSQTAVVTSDTLIKAHNDNPTVVSDFIAIISQLPSHIVHGQCEIFKLTVPAEMFDIIKSIANKKEDVK